MTDIAIPGLDVSSLDFEQIRAFQAILNAEAAKKQSAARQEALSTIVRLVTLHDFNAGELNKAITAAQKGTKAATTKPGNTVAPKYRNPETGQTWTGRGVAPAWMPKDKDMRDAFLILPGENAVPAAASSAQPVAPLSEAQVAQHDTNVGRTIAETPAVTPATGGPTSVFSTEEDDNAPDPVTDRLPPSSLFAGAQAQMVPAE